MSSPTPVNLCHIRTYHELCFLTFLFFGRSHPTWDAVLSEWTGRTVLGPLPSSTAAQHARILTLPHESSMPERQTLMAKQIACVYQEHSSFFMVFKVFWYTSKHHYYRKTVSTMSVQVCEKRWNLTLYHLGAIF